MKAKTNRSQSWDSIIRIFESDIRKERSRKRRKRSSGTKAIGPKTVL